MKRTIRWLVVLLIAIIAGLMFMTQRAEDVLVRDPGNRMYNPPMPVAVKAAEEAVFAAMSENAYVDTWEAPIAESRTQTTRPNAQTVCSDTGHNQPVPLPGWRRWPGFPSADLIQEAKKVDLYFEVWESESTSPRIVVVVFRGTDSWIDFLSNFRWIFRYVPFHEDQYHFVSRRVGEEFSKRIAADAAAYKGAAILSAGHSLGGGLAQHFAYSLPPNPDVPRVSRIFAFDPSPVTGWSTVKKEIRSANAAGLKTDRIFEHGEILAYLRLLFSYVSPPPAVDPSVTEIRYNFVRSVNPLSSHSMRQLACSLLQVGGAPASP